MFDGCLYFNLTTLNRRITKIWQDEFARLGLSPSHAYLLMAISTHPEANQKQLRTIMELDASTITRFIDALVSKKLIAREGVGKGSSIKLTQSGEDTAQELDKVGAKLKQQMQGFFGEEAFADMVANLHQMRQMLAQQQET